MYIMFVIKISRNLISHGWHRENMRFIKSIGISLIGIVIVMMGLVYDILLAGIPYPDPTPELQVRYDFHSFVAGIFYKTGGIVFLVGLVAIPFIWKMAKKKQCQQVSPADARTSNC